MNSTRIVHGLEQQTEIVSKVEGMEIIFDEKVTLFPVELEEIHEVTSKRNIRRGSVSR